MRFSHFPRPTLDLSKPNVARMHDYYMGGNHNYLADRQVAARVVRAAPEITLAVRETQEFTQRALRFLMSKRNVHQILVIGSGLPTQHMPHEFVEKLNPYACVCYVDYDPFVLAYLHATLVGREPYVGVVDGDLRQPESIFLQRRLNQLIDFYEPVALILTHVLEFIPGEELLTSVIKKWKEHLAPGSYLVISHATSDGQHGRTLKVIESAYSEATERMTMRSRNQLRRLLKCFKLVHPGMVYAHLWHPDDRPDTTPDDADSAGSRWAYAAVAQKI